MNPLRPNFAAQNIWPVKQIAAPQMPATAKTNVDAGKELLDSSVHLSEQSLQLYSKAQQGGVELQQPQKRERHVSDEMAEMLENLQRAEERDTKFGDDLQGKIKAELQAQRNVVLLQDPGENPPPPESSPSIDGALANLLKSAQNNTDKKALQTGHSGGHQHSHDQGHAHLGAHIGLEAGEHGIHHLSHAATHAADIKGSVVDIKAAVVDAKATAISHGVEGVDSAVSHQATQIAEHGSSTALNVASGLIGGLSGLLGIFMFKSGLKQIKEGRKNKDLEQKIEGANSMVVGTRSVAAGAVAAGHLIHGSEVVATVAGIAKSALTPLGIVHGAVDIGLGARDAYKGGTEGNWLKFGKGLSGVGLGTSLVLAATGLGLPAVAGAAVFLVPKVLCGHYDAKRSREQQQLQHAQGPAPGADQTHSTSTNSHERVHQ